MYQILWSLDVWVGDMVTDVQISIVLVTFELFTSWQGGKIKFGDNVILRMWTSYQDHCMYVWVVMVADGQTW